MSGRPGLVCESRLGSLWARWLHVQQLATIHIINTLLTLDNTPGFSPQQCLSGLEPAVRFIPGCCSNHGGSCLMPWLCVGGQMMGSFGTGLRLIVWTNSQGRQPAVDGAVMHPLVDLMCSCLLW